MLYFCNSFNFSFLGFNHVDILNYFSASFFIVSLDVPSVKKAIGKAKDKTKGADEGVVQSELVRMTQYQHLIDNRELPKEMLQNKW